MRIFVAGASGVIGIRLVPLLVAEGHAVAALTRSARKAPELEKLGAVAVVCDVYDFAALRDAVVAFEPDAVMHQLTDLPDDVSKLGALSERNDRMRTEGTHNLIAAAQAAAAQHLYAQSIAWKLPPDRAATVETHERAILAAGGVVIRYGQLYGPGTYYETEQPPPPKIAVDEAARRTMELLDAPSAVFELVD
jgi:uncharacterized protein YbjT (DUF2867 family)